MGGARGRREEGTARTTAFLMSWSVGSLCSTVSISSSSALPDWSRRADNCHSSESRDTWMKGVAPISVISLGSRLVSARAATLRTGGASAVCGCARLTA